ncbi:MAG TPA: TetR/AcrR family transcriptional regulator [Solirubrobacteraceae bacterium]|nr:TetR/AcrR family transcriptional regulator [Solirubrobacteraceae bacterium]
MSRVTPKGTQRERLIDAIVELAGQFCYQGLSIAQISARAGVSSATFYEQFADREECLLAAYRAVTERTLVRMASSLQEGEWARAARPAFAEVIRSVQADPDGGRVMFVEAAAGGPRLREEARSVLDGMVANAEVLLDEAPAGGVTLDIPSRALIGAVRSVVSGHLRTHSEDRLPRLTEDMLAWMASYAVASERGRWSTGSEALLPGASRLSAGVTAEPEDPAALGRLPRGRHGLPAGAVARSQRTRLIHATASVTMAKGYASTTVADIVASAGVAKEAFYKHFRDKEQAFLEAQEHPTHQILDAVVFAYFSAEEWHERIWRALRTLADLIAANPAMSHLRLVECYTAGPAAIRRAEEIVHSFTIFLEEGYRTSRDAEGLPRLFSQTISGAIFELIQHEVVAGRTEEIPACLPQLAYVAMAPFLGPAKTIELLREKIAESGAAAQ